MKYAYLEKGTNKLLGWYTDDVHSTWIPPVYEDIEEDVEETSLSGEVITTKKIVKKLVKDGYYDNSNIPTPNVEVNDEVWQEAININANYYENDKFVFKDFRTEEEIYQSTIPSLITMRQARLYLLSKDLLDNVEALVSTNKAWQIEWEYASDVQRTNQLIPALQSALGLFDTDVDDMFIEASKL